jgi:hypothetical protein
MERRELDMRPIRTLRRPLRLPQQLFQIPPNVRSSRRRHMVPDPHVQATFIPQPGARLVHADELHQVVDGNAADLRGQRTGSRGREDGVRGRRGRGQTFQSIKPPSFLICPGGLLKSSQVRSIINPTLQKLRRVSRPGGLLLSA